MATVRVEKIKDYTTLSNRLLDDDRLSFKAVGLLTYMLRLPDDWDFTLEWLAKKHRDGLSSIRSAMKELEDAGYVTRGDQRRGEGGTFQGSDYIVREDPDTDRPVTACENRIRTACENPTSVFPTSDNRTQLNTKMTKDKETNPPKPPRGQRVKREPMKATAWKPERFEGFWRYYPTHTSKQAAMRAWDRLKPGDELIATIGKALRRQKATDQWSRGIGIPYAATYLNQRRWEDEPDEPVLLPDEEPEVVREWI